MINEINSLLQMIRIELIQPYLYQRVLIKIVRVAQYEACIEQELLERHVVMEDDVVPNPSVYHLIVQAIDQIDANF